MDISSGFKETVQSIIYHHKKIPNVKKRKTEKNNNFFTTRVELIANQINDFYEVIWENRQAYLNSSISPFKKRYESDNRNEIEFFAGTIMDRCLKLVVELKKKVLNPSLTQQNEEHNRIIISGIEECLKYICKVYSEQQMIRSKKASEMGRPLKSKLEKKQTQNSDLQNLHEPFNTENDPTISRVNSLIMQEMNGDMYELMDSENHPVDSKDIQLFEAENEQLYNELNTLTEEMKEIENKVVYISDLQNIFSEKILYQDKNLEHVLATVVGSTENVKEANEQIRNAIQKNAGFRVWILFFLLVLSFSLIFLDWYKP